MLVLGTWEMGNETALVFLLIFTFLSPVTMLVAVIISRHHIFISSCYSTLTGVRQAKEANQPIRSGMVLLQGAAAIFMEATDPVLDCIHKDSSYAAQSVGAVFIALMKKGKYQVEKIMKTYNFSK